MNALRRQSKIAYMALLFWIFASGSGIYGHYCFDGSEPPVSVHFDLMDNHDKDSHNEAGHLDVDAKPMSVVLVKLLNLDLPFLAAALLLLIIWPLTRGQNFTYFNTPLTWLSITGLRPPLRAPPAYSH